MGLSEPCAFPFTPLWWWCQVLNDLTDDHGMSYEESISRPWDSIPSDQCCMETWFSIDTRNVTHLEERWLHLLVTAVGICRFIQEMLHQLHFAWSRICLSMDVTWEVNWDDPTKFTVERCILLTHTPKLKVRDGQVQRKHQVLSRWLPQTIFVFVIGLFQRKKNALQHLFDLSLTSIYDMGVVLKTVVYPPFPNKCLYLNPKKKKHLLLNINNKSQAQHEQLNDILTYINYTGQMNLSTIVSLESCAGPWPCAAASRSCSSEPWPTGKITTCNLTELGPKDDRKMY